jgi:hypothetical protein
MRSRPTAHQTIRARGPYIRGVRWLVFVVWAYSAMARGSISTSFWVSLIALVALEAALLRPRVVASEMEVVLVGIVSRTRFDRDAISAIRLAPSAMFWFNTLELCVVTDSDAVSFRWVAWSDWRQYGFTVEVPTPRQQRLLTVISTGESPPGKLRWF